MMSAIPFRLEAFDVIRATGNDAEAFLQAQLSSDVLELTVQSAQWTALLSPQGRVQALMALFRRDLQDYALIVPHRQGARIVEALRRFILRRKVKLELDPALAVFGCSKPDTEPMDGFSMLQLDPLRRLGVDVATIESLAAPAHWFAADFEAGIPWLPEAAADQHLPHALGLERLAAFSLRKGCYPGQEIVARTHYLGRNKRQLCLLQAERAGASPPAIGAKLRDADGGLAGEIVDAGVFDGRMLALSVMQRERISMRFHIENPASDGQAMDYVKDF